MTTLRIAQLAERAGVKASTLRFYEQAGLLAAERSAAGYRLYDEAAVDRLEFIASGKHLGLPLAEIRDLLTGWDDGRCADVRDRLRPLVADRIAEAERRATELDVFTDRLRWALTELDGPPRPGRCDPSCNFQHHQPPAPPIACTLSGPDQAERVRQWQRLLAGATTEVLDGGVLVRLPAESAAAVAELAVAEQRCCPFFAFTLRLTGERVELDVRVPAGAEPLLAELFGRQS
jgi:MerR family transcriptional regulator, copper efflux regulator